MSTGSDGAGAKDGGIVVGVEDSELSDAAVEVAFRLGRQRGVEVVPVHAGDLPGGWWHHVAEEDLARGREATLERLTHRLAGAGLDPTGLQGLRVVPGPPAAALLKEAKGAGAGLIVVGRHRSEGVAHFFGDTVRGTLAGAECPVWVQSGPPGAIERVLVGVDPVDSMDDARACVVLAREEAERHGAKLVLMYGFVQPELGAIFGYPVPLPPSVVLSAREAAQERFGELNDGFDWKGRPHEAQFVDGDPAGELLERSGPGDLIVLGSPERGLLARALLGSVTTGVLRDAQVPVLALRPTLDHD